MKIAHTFPQQQVPKRKTFQSVSRLTGKTEMLPNASNISEKQHKFGFERENEIPDVVNNNPPISSRQIAI